MADRQTGPIRSWLLIALAVGALILIVIGPMIFGRFTLNVLTRSMIYAILAVTVDLLWGYAGILTFGQAAFFGVGAYAAAMVLTHLGGEPAFMLLAAGLALFLPMILGVVVGWLSFGNSGTPLYATVISLVLPIVITQLVFSGGVWTGSSSGLVGYPTIAFGLQGYFRLAGASLFVVALLAWLFVRSDAGKLLIAIRDNEPRCAYLGINPERIKTALMTVLAGVAGLAGFLFANASGVVAPENTGFVFGTELVVWTALGGRGTIIGPIAGTLGIDYLSATLSGELPFLWSLIVGVLFVVMIIVLPNGLAALFTRVFRAGQTNGTALTEAPVDANRPAPPPGPIIAIENLAKSYGSLNVLEGIDLAVAPGELVSLVGPNGAGKTTLMRCISNGTEAISGSIRIADQPIAGLTPDRIVGLGVGRKFQVASVFDSLTVAECLRLARASIDRPRRFHRSTTLALPSAAIDILRLTGLDQDVDRPVKLLSHGQKQALELAMVVALEPRLILLDEPTAGLTKTERATIGRVLKQLTEVHGMAAILVEHDLDFVRDISSRIVVLHQGRLVLDGTVDEVIRSELVSRIYSGAAHA